MPSGSEVSVVISTFNREGLLPELIDHLKAQTVDDLDVIIVDNGSVDGTWPLLAHTAAADERFRVLRIEQNRGPARSRNLGWRSTDRPLIAFTDDDCLPEPAWIESLLDHARSRPLIVQGRTAPPEHGPHRNWFDRTVSISSWSGMFETCNLLVDRATLETLGGFSEDFPDAMGEDTDLGYRATAMGVPTEFAPSAVVRHRIWPQGFRGFCRQRRRFAKSVSVIRRNPRARRDHLVAGVFIRSSHILIWALIPITLISVRLNQAWIPPLLVAAWAARHAYQRRSIAIPLPKRFAYSLMTFAGYVYETIWFAIESVRQRTAVI